jgi:hypothetical protein
MKKRFFCLLLVIGLAFCFSAMAFAQEIEMEDGTIVILKDAPLNLKVKSGILEGAGEGVKFPVFEITWDNPSSIIALEESLPPDGRMDLFIAVDYRIPKDPSHRDWESEVWGESSDFSGTYTRPSEKKLIFNTASLVLEEDGVYTAADFEIRICYSFMYDNPHFITSPYTGLLSTTSYEGASPWAVSELDKAVKLGLITDKIRDKMDAPISREEFAEIAVLFYEKTSGNQATAAPKDTFSDSDNVEVLKAYALKITNGAGKDPNGRELFKPRDLLNREQMAAMITRTLKAVYPAIDLTTSGVASFTDENSISSWALESTKFIKKYKISEGIGNNLYGPKQLCTREQAVVFLMRSLDKKAEYTIK